MIRAKTPRVSIVVLLGMFAGLTWAGIEGSKHDFSNEAWSKDDTCGACHVPHRQQIPKAAPLWDPDADLTRTFGAGKTPTNLPGGGTRMCIRCHDGTIAKDTLPAAKRERFVYKQHPGLFSSGHQTSDHPVGIEYPQFDKGFRPMTSVLASGTVILPDGRVECISCHDPHNQAGNDHMLVRSNARSALCLTCHEK
ncbi:MAG: cytochrome c3 family protein [Phycisphaerae bacterium]